MMRKHGKKAVAVMLTAMLAFTSPAEFAFAAGMQVNPVTETSASASDTSAENKEQGSVQTDSGTTDEGANGSGVGTGSEENVEGDEEEGFTETNEGSEPGETTSTDGNEEDGESDIELPEGSQENGETEIETPENSQENGDTETSGDSQENGETETKTPENSKENGESTTSNDVIPTESPEESNKETTVDSALESEAVITESDQQAKSASRFHTISTKDYNIAPGIKENRYVMNTENGDEQLMAYSITVDTSSGSSGVIAGYGNDDGSKWSMQTLTAQGRAVEKKRNINIVGGINGDLFNMATGEPQGVLVMTGTVYRTDSGHPYVAILNDGTVEIREKGTPLGDNVKDAIGGQAILIKDGVKQEMNDEVHPLAAVGIKADGSVILLAVDGRQAPVSVGLTHNDLAGIMIDMGCVDALRLDGGGSMTMMTQREGTEDLVVRNSPSDGVERAISSSLLVYSNAESDGQFDHATIEPADEIYTPGSVVAFEATGVDSGGYPAEIPAQATWQLDEASKNLGSISADGTFTSNGTQGDVTVNLVVNGTVKGSTTIKIAAPDSISFRQSEISAAFDADIEMDLIVKFEGRDVNYKVGDFNWTMDNPNLGTMNGNTFHSSNGGREEGTITATSVYDSAVSGSLHVIVGKEPTIAWDFEDPDYYTIDTEGSNFKTSNAGRGAKQSAELVTIDSGEPVRFGNSALKINYDFTAPPSGTDGAYFGAVEDIEIPGTPTSIGVWVYAPEGTGNFWLRGYLRNPKTGTADPVDFTLQTSQATEDTPAGIYWEGWKYCEADLSAWEPPFILAGGQTLRIMYVPGINMGTKTAGSLYFDNLQFVYGESNSDVDAPVIDSVLANEQTLEDNMTFDTETIDFEASFYDVENKYTTGIDYSTVNAYIDGRNVEESGIEYYLDQGGNTLYLYDVKLTKGTHSLKILVRDLFGNESVVTKYFTVNNENAAETAVSIVPNDDDLPILGKDYVLNVQTRQLEDISEISAEILIDKAYESTYKVEFSEDYTGTASYNKITRILSIQATRKEGAQGTGSGNIARIVFPISKDTKEGTIFSYTIRTGRYVSKSLGAGSFSDSPKEIEIEAMYSLTSDPMILGSEGTIYVTDRDGNPVSGVSVFQGNDDKVIGSTDKNGELKTDALCQNSGTYEIYAEDKDGNRSFVKEIVCSEAAGSEKGEPYNILHSAAENPDTEKNIVWMSHPLVTKKAVVQYAEKSAYEDKGNKAFELFDGESSIQEFTAGAASAARVNSAYLTGLKPDTTYSYRVGDGKVWSEVMEFTTEASDQENTNFFVIADVQSEDMSEVDGILDTVSGEDYTFGIQTGDGVDSAINYEYWKNYNQLFSADRMGGKDVIHVLGNHEYEGNLSGDIANAIYNLPGQKYYSVTYGNVYVAVINYTTSKDALQEALDWLEKDAASSSARWKVLAMHQPAYYTNTTGGNGYIHDMVPSVAEKAGIDFVFSGHDHSYARTQPLTGGNVDQENGVVYYISGSTGEKSYSVVDNPEFHFAKVTGDYDSVYLSVEATEKAFTVRAMEADGRVIDSYTKQDPCAKGHTYEYTEGKLTCSVCGKTITTEDYTGLVKDVQTGRKMYFKDGIVTTGVQEYAGKRYCFDQNGLAYDGTFTYAGASFTIQDGEFVSSTDSSVAYIVGIGETEDGLRWIISNNFVLRIDGSGAMKNYSQTDKAPWVSRQAWVHTAYIGKDITSIGNYGLFTLNELREIHFEEGSRLQSIGSHAFQFTKISAITLPETVSAIGNYAFAENRHLAEITIPQAVTKLSYGAFQGCSGLTKATIPETVTSIEGEVFDKCQALTIYGVKDGVADLYAERHAIPFESTGNAVYQGTVNNQLSWSYTDGTLTINGNGAMQDMEGYTGQPWYKMENGVKLQERIKKVVIGAGVESIGAYAFIGYKNLQEVVFEGAEQAKITAIGKHAFQNTAITVVSLPASVKTLGNYCFAGCEELKTVEIPEGLGVIPYGAFQGCVTLEKVTLPVSLTMIEGQVFDQCPAVVIYGLLDTKAQEYAQKNNIAFEATGTAAYEGAITESMRWGYSDGVLTITGSGRMTDCSVNGGQPWERAYNGVKLQDRIEKVVIGSGVENIGAYAFFHAENLSTVVFEGESTLKSIDKHAFQGSSLIRMEMPNSITELGNYAFADCEELKEVSVSTGVEVMPYAAFSGSNNLYKVVLPASIQAFNSQVFAGCDRLTITCDEGSAAESYADSHDIPVIFTGSSAQYGGKFGNGLRWEFESGELRILGNGTMPEYEAEGEQPWKNAGGVDLQGMIETITIGKDVENIGAYAFFNLSAVKTVTFEEGSNLKNIGKHAFQNLSIAQITLPDTVETIERTAFAGCSELTAFRVPANVSVLTYAMFQGCTSLETVYIPETVTFIENDIVKDCPKVMLQGVKDGIADYYATKWGIPYQAEGQASYEGDLGTGVHWKYSDGVMTFSGEGAIPDYENYFSQPWYRMDNTVKLQNRIKKVVIGKDVTEIGAYALFDAVNMREIEFEEGSVLKRIGKHSMRGTMISAINLPDSVTSIERYAFEGNTLLKEVKIPTGVRTVCYATFQNCDNLVKAEIPKTVLLVEDLAFENCPEVTIYGAKDSAADEYAADNGISFVPTEYETFGGQLTSSISWEYSNGTMIIAGSGAMPDYETYNKQPWYKTENGIKLLPKIEKLIVEKGITRIGAYAFFGAENLETVIFEGTGLQSVGKHAFQNSGITEIELKNRVKSIENYAFAGCKNLKKAYVPEATKQFGVSVFEDCSKISIYGTAGSSAEEFAKQNKLPFVDMNK